MPERRRDGRSGHRSPSAVSLQIGKLEDLLGTRLLDRDARHVALTDQGETLLAQARRLLHINDDTIALFRRSPLAGRLHLSAPHDLGVSLVPRLLRRLADDGSEMARACAELIAAKMRPSPGIAAG